jgi:hypothetical protein
MMAQILWTVLGLVVAVLIYAKGVKAGRRDYRYELRGMMHQGFDIEHFLEADDDV